MDILVISDIHGRKDWIPKVKRIADYDKIIFLGDYTDSFNISSLDINNNLRDIIEFKEKHMDKVVLLLGNHDLQYMYGYSRHGCSGFRSESYSELKTLFNIKRHLFQVAFQVQKTIWTHAGITERWWKNKFSQYDTEIDIATSLNKAFLEYVSCLFDIGHYRGGFDPVSGIFWADKRETENDPLEGYTQIIGHTVLPEIVIYNHNDNTKVIYTDTGDFVSYYDHTIIKD